MKGPEFSFTKVEEDAKNCNQHSNKISNNQKGSFRKGQKSPMAKNQSLLDQIKDEFNKKEQTQKSNSIFLNSFEGNPPDPFTGQAGGSPGLKGLK